jgi:hypothetical protein
MFRFMCGIEVPCSSGFFVELLSVRCAYVELVSAPPGGGARIKHWLTAR